MSIKHTKNPLGGRIRTRLSPVLKRLIARGHAVLVAIQRVGVDQDIRWTRKFAARFLRVLVLAGMSMPVNQIPVRASALTYTTILSFVPFAVILSAVAGHFGYLDLLPQLVTSLAATLKLDVDLEPILAVIKVAQRVDFQRLGLVGSLGLLFTFFLSMSNIELAMDHIWDIRKKRNWWKRIKEFTPFLILLILLVIGVGNVLIKYRTFLNSKLAGIGPNGFVHETILLVGSLSVVGFLWLTLVLVFFIVPNTRVRLFPAILAATLSTTGIYFLTRGLALLPHMFFSKNNFIYGSLAVFPVALLMIYLLWLIVLYGAAVAFIYQRLYHHRGKSIGPEANVSPAFHRMEKEVIEVLKAVHSLSGAKTAVRRRFVTMESLSEELWDDAGSIEALAAPLVELGLIVKRKVQTGAVYAPLRSLGQVDLTAIHNLLLRLDPKGMGTLKTLTAFDELNHTLGILYSSGKRNPPLYFWSVQPDGEPRRK